MSTKQLTYLIVAIVVAHFLFAVGYLIYKIAKAPKSDPEDQDSSTTS